ncbi:MAG: zinc ABC transporter substrate-binding protein [Flammeovirgaceae bacterium]|nr:zinc ABC transporter substrate-binding protein [Flammeovirgaceae bacterium]MDW8288487.1 zinc ABC transporter substrate-binding protein [Flammeovirgaceae bacterium]
MKEVITWLCFLILLGSISCQEEKNSEQKGLYIVATTGMVADVVKNVAGEKADVEPLMGAGVDPHLYKPSQSDLPKLRRADVVFYNGLHLEGKMSEILEKLAENKPVYALSEAIVSEKLHRVSGSAVDPHIWFDVSLWAMTVPFVAKKLGEIDTTNADYYRENAIRYQKQLELLHEEVKQMLAQIPQEKRVLVTAHDAFGYFGRAYQVEVKGLQGISTVSEFGVKEITDMVDFIVERKIKAVFVESSVPTKSIEAVMQGCRQKGHAVRMGGNLFSDAMGADNTPEGTYIGMVRHNVKTIVEALQ